MVHVRGALATSLLTSLSVTPDSVRAIRVLTCGFFAQPFPSFLDVSRSLAGRMRDDRRQARSATPPLYFGVGQRVGWGKERREVWSAPALVCLPGAPGNRRKPPAPFARALGGRGLTERWSYAPGDLTARRHRATSDVDGDRRHVRLGVQAHRGMAACADSSGIEDHPPAGSPAGLRHRGV